MYVKKIHVKLNEPNKKNDTKIKRVLASVAREKSEKDKENPKKIHNNNLNKK